MAYRHWINMKTVENDDEREIQKISKLNNFKCSIRKLCWS